MLVSLSTTLHDLCVTVRVGLIKSASSTYASPHFYVKTVAGVWNNQAFRDGVGTAALFNYPYAVCADQIQQVLYVIDDHVRKYVPATGLVTSISPGQ